ncbi:ArnT family glycosyltransferase [Streptomyces sp. NPDC019531]|uniref:ArnT family glycosyltransferase n=1 Tax=Streptomyces sp. NPDC019531 TaxID=3365062 RepID=UPI00384E6F50
MTTVEARRVQKPTPRQTRRGVPTSVLAAGVFLLTAGLRLVNVGRSADFFVDELIYRQLGVSAAQGGFPHTSEGLFFLHPPGYFYVEAGWGKLVGISPDVVTGLYQARMVNIFLGAITAVLVLLLVSKAGSRTAGVVAALLFALDPYIIRQNDRVMLDTQTVMFVLAGYLVLLPLAREPLPDRVRLRAVAAGLLFGLALLTKDHSALISVVPLILALILRWGPPRRLLLTTLGAAIVPYGLYVALVGLYGHFNPFWYNKSHGAARLIGLVQESGFHAAGTPSLTSRLIDQVTTFASTYALLVLGPVALVILLRRKDPVLRMLALFHLCAGLTLAFALAHGTLEEQALYLLIVPTVVVQGAALAVGIEHFRQRDGRRVLRSVLLVALVGFLTATVTFSGVSYAKVHTGRDDGYARLRGYMDKHVPLGSAVIAADGGASGGISSWALRDRYVMGDWVTPEARTRAHARYLVVPWKVIDQGYGTMDARTARLLAAEGHLVFAFHGRSYGTLALYKLPLPDEAYLRVRATAHGLRTGADHGP